MDSLAKSDIFFVITSFAVAIIAILLAVALVYAIRLIREAREIVAAIRKESDMLIADVEDARAFIKREGSKVGALLGFMGGFLKRKAKKVKKVVEDVTGE